MPLQEVTQYYYELQPDALIKQPWNAYSSLFFFLPVAFWTWKLRGKYRQYPVLVAVLPLAFLNGVGSTLWHANNGGMLFGLLDVLPPFLMMAFLCVYFWRISLGRWLWGILFVLGYVGLMAGVLYAAQGAGGVNLYYLMMGLMVIVPNLIILRKTKGQGWHLVAMALGFIGLALFFRSIDQPNPVPELLPMGTHFLWHIVSVGAMFPLGYYLIRLQHLHLRLLAEQKTKN